MRVASLTDTLNAADAREVDLRNRVTELVATNETLTKTLSDQKQRLSQAQRELSANKVELIGERLAAQQLQSKLNVVSEAFASASTELEAVRLYREIPVPVIAEPALARPVDTDVDDVEEGAISEDSVLGVDLGQVLSVLNHQAEPPAVSEGNSLAPAPR